VNGRGKADRGAGGEESADCAVVSSRRALPIDDPAYQTQWTDVSMRDDGTAGDTVLRAVVSERMQPGVVYTTFHFPESGANVITTDNSDWATNCPEYKVTAVEIVKVNQPSEWQKRFHEFTDHQLELLKGREATHA